MTTITDVANQTLAMIGANPIASIDDASEEARVIKRLWNFSRKAVLRDIAPNFARRYKLSSPTADDFPIADYFHVHNVPASSLRVMQMKAPDSNASASSWLVYREGLPFARRWKVFGRYIGVDYKEVWIIYVIDIDAMGEWDANTIEALSCHLAWKAAYPLTQSKTVRNEMKDQYHEMKEDATVNDGLEGIHDKFYTESRITSVRSGRQGIVTGR